jgi:hypothetical protein
MSAVSRTTLFQRFRYSYPEPIESNQRYHYIWCRF